LISTQVAGKHELLSLVKKKFRAVSPDNVALINSRACLEAKWAFAAAVAMDPSERDSDIRRLLDVLEQVTNNPPTPDAELRRLAPLAADLTDKGAFAEPHFNADGKPRPKGRAVATRSSLSGSLRVNPSRLLV
jgi:hypothetical protein